MLAHRRRGTKIDRSAGKTSPLFSTRAAERERAEELLRASHQTQAKHRKPLLTASAGLRPLGIRRGAEVAARRRDGFQCYRGTSATRTRPVAGRPGI